MIVDTYAGPTMGCIKSHGGGPTQSLECVGYTTSAPSALFVCSEVCAHPHSVRTHTVTPTAVAFDRLQSAQ